MFSKRLLVMGIVLLLAVGSIGFFWPYFNDTAVFRLLAFWNTASGLRLPGIVEVQEVRLGSKIGGRVKTVKVLEGEIVEPAQELVIFDMPELEAQLAQWEARLAATEALADKAENGPRPDEIRAAEAALGAAKAREQRLRKGWRDEEVLQAKSELAAAEADLQQARERFTRLSVPRPGSRDAISQDEMQAALAARNSAQGRRDAQLARYEMLTAGSRPEDIAEAESLTRQAQANLKLLQLGTRDEDKKNARANVLEIKGKIAELRANLREAVVRAPERAVVDVVGVRAGDIIPPNQPIVRVLRAADMWVRVYVPETELGKIKLNQAAKVTIDGFPDKVFTGTVIHIATDSEFTPRNVQSPTERRHQVFGIKVRVSDSQGIFKAGMAAEVLFEFQ